jgi:predicted Zn-dependent protease
MSRLLAAAWLALAGIAGGCLSSASPTALVPANPFNPPPAAPAVSKADMPPAPIEAAARVDRVGRQVVAANKQLGLSPLFRTIGAPQPEVFHLGTTEIDVTEGLVNLCQTEGQLAAVLCGELGKMVAEREARAGPQTRSPEREPPLEVRVGNDNAGSFGSADQTRLAELGLFEQKRRKSESQAQASPNPAVLARQYLVRAGYAEKDFDAVTPLLRAAAENKTFARQLTLSQAGQKQ